MFKKAAPVVFCVLALLAFMQLEISNCWGKSGLVLSSKHEAKVSVVIVYKNFQSNTLMCIAALRRHTTVPFELVLVDDGSDTRDPRVETEGDVFVRNPKSLGYTLAVNIGARLASGSYIAFLNNDAYVHAGWLEALLATFHAFPSAGLVGSKMINSDGSLQEAGSIIFSDGSAWNYGGTQDPNDVRYNFVRDVDYCSAAAILVSKTALVSVGYFDERYAPAYYEDTDLAMAIRQKSFSVLYQPMASVTHVRGLSHSGTMDDLMKKNHETFVAKWREVLERDHHAPTNHWSDEIAIPKWLAAETLPEDQPDSNATQQTH